MKFLMKFQIFQRYVFDERQKNMKYQLWGGWRKCELKIVFSYKLWSYNYSVLKMLIK